MSVTIKSAREIELMREAGRLLEIVHDEMAKIIRPGISTMEMSAETKPSVVLAAPRIS